MEKIKMIEYCGEMVPAELCTIDREGGADDFVGCGACFNDPSNVTCENCVVSRILNEYARLTGQLPKANVECNSQEGEEPDVENFIVNYADGTQRTIEKGFFCEIKPEGGEILLAFIMANCSGQDLATIVYGCIELGNKLGLFGKNTNQCRS